MDRNGFSLSLSLSEALIERLRSPQKWLNLLYNRCNSDAINVVS